MKNYVYSVAWVIWLFACLAAPLFYGTWYIAGLAGWFVFWEGLALYDEDEDDTFSENTWLFSEDSPARLIMVQGFVVHLLCLVLALVFPYLEWVGLAFFVTGFFWWLWDHFTYYGSKG